MPGRHSLAQRGAPERSGCERLSHCGANTSFRPRNKLVNNAARPSAVLIREPRAARSSSVIVARSSACSRSRTISRGRTRRSSSSAGAGIEAPDDRGLSGPLASMRSCTSLIWSS
jgi:hypothetical protein